MRAGNSLSASMIIKFLEENLEKNEQNSGVMPPRVGPLVLKMRTSRCKVELECSKSVLFSGYSWANKPRHALSLPEMSNEGSCIGLSQMATEGGNLLSSSQVIGNLCILVPPCNTLRTPRRCRGNFGPPRCRLEFSWPEVQKEGLSDRKVAVNKLKFCLYYHNIK